MTKARAEKNDFRAVGQQDAQTGLGAENYDRSGEVAANQGEANCRNRWWYVAMSGDFRGRNRNLLTEFILYHTAYYV